MRGRLAMMSAALALLCACGGGAGNRFGPEGAWRGELTGTRAGRPLALCLQIEDYDISQRPERFGGAVFLGGVRHDLTSGLWGPGDTIAFAADGGSFSGFVAVERLYGSWKASPGGALQDAGGWTLQRAKDATC